jgi:hypothetical protein
MFKAGVKVRVVRAWVATQCPLAVDQTPSRVRASLVWLGVAEVLSQIVNVCVCVCVCVCGERERDLSDRHPSRIDSPH